MVAQGIERDQILLRATALTYFAMLSLIPILALAIGLVGAFGVSEDLARVVVDRVAAGSPDAGQYILDLVRRVNFRSFGAVGGASLFVTTVLGIGNVEKAFNTIWGIERQRSLMRRFADYLAVLVVAPLLFTAAVSLATSLRSETILQQVLAHPALAQAYELGLRQTPTLLLLLGFAFLYWFLPNTNVRALPALLGRTGGRRPLRTRPGALHRFQRRRGAFERALRELRRAAAAAGLALRVVDRGAARLRGGVRRTEPPLVPARARRRRAAPCRARGDRDRGRGATSRAPSATAAASPTKRSPHQLDVPVRSVRAILVRPRGRRHRRVARRR